MPGARNEKMKGDGGHGQGIPQRSLDSSLLLARLLPHCAQEETEGCVSS